MGTETSQYREDKKSNEMPLVVASEGGTAQTEPVEKPAGVAGSGLWGLRGQSGSDAAEDRKPSRTTWNGRS